MSGFERQIALALSKGEVVSYKAIPIYSGDNLLPSGLTLQARGSNGLSLDVSIQNVSAVPLE